jgi:hypothetical protein
MAVALAEFFMADPEEDITLEATEVGLGVAGAVPEDFEVECLSRETHLIGVC